ncbi:HigA family addiction module antidote protein [candidate division KSB1 bacterium]|nr:HigA family addiction module antidote protein [candidate division KSB1 bacterium]
MRMHNPPHPGEFIRGIYLEPYNLSIRQVAEKLQVSPSTLSRLIKGQSDISSEMALRLSKTLGRTPESWLIMQNQFDLWQAQQKIDIDKIEELKFI